MGFFRARLSDKTFSGKLGLGLKVPVTQEMKVALKKIIFLGYSMEKCALSYFNLI